MTARHPTWSGGGPRPPGRAGDQASLLGQHGLPAGGERRVVPGIRLSGGARHDQARAASPQEAVANGADLLVIGRTVTKADDPAAAAAAIAAAV